MLLQILHVLSSDHDCSILPCECVHHVRIMYKYYARRWQLRPIISWDAQVCFPLTASVKWNNIKCSQIKLLGDWVTRLAHTYQCCIVGVYTDVSTMMNQQLSFLFPPRARANYSISLSIIHHSLSITANNIRCVLFCAWRVRKDWVSWNGRWQDFIWIFYLIKAKICYITKKSHWYGELVRSEFLDKGWCRWGGVKNTYRLVEAWVAEVRKVDQHVVFECMLWSGGVIGKGGRKEARWGEEN